MSKKIRKRRRRMKIINGLKRMIASSINSWEPLCTREQRNRDTTGPILTPEEATWSQMKAIPTGTRPKLTTGWNSTIHV